MATAPPSATRASNEKKSSNASTSTDRSMRPPNERTWTEVAFPAAMKGTVQELRRTRRVRRLGDLEWFEIAYRVYLAALVGGGVVLWAADQVSDVPATAAQIADLNEHGPAI